MALQGAGLQQLAGVIGLIGGRLNQTDGRPTESQKHYDTVRAGVRANIRKYGIQRPAFAITNFNMPTIFGGYGEDDDGVSLSEFPTAFDIGEVSLLARYRCDQFVQPGMQLATSEIKRYGIGTVERKPTVPIFIDQPFHFINDSDGVLRKFFSLWLQGIVNFADLPTANALTDTFGKKPMEVEYKDNYKTNMQIMQYNDVQEKVLLITLHNAYPIYMSDINNSWSADNQMSEFTVTFTYSHWSIEEMDVLQLREPRAQAGSDFSLLKAIVQATTVIQQFSTMGMPNSAGDVLRVVNTGAGLLKSMTRKDLQY
jgi:hypothetical protein